MEGYGRLMTFAAGLPRDTLSVMGGLGDRSVRGAPAHMIAWRELFFRWDAAGRRGEQPQLPAPRRNWAQLPAFNQTQRGKWKLAAAPMVIARLAESRARVIAFGEEIWDPMLVFPDQVSRTGKPGLLSLPEQFVWSALSLSLRGNEPQPARGFLRVGSPQALPYN